MKQGKQAMKLTIEDIQRCFYVDETGTVRWKQSVEPASNNRLWQFRGTVAGALTAPETTGLQYRQIGYTKQGKVHQIKAHVVAYVVHNGKFPEGQVDHLDGDGLNNSEVNLRSVSSRVNLCNARLNKRNTSGVKGVTPVKQYPGMWRADAGLNGRVHKLYKGYDFFLAVCARKSFEAKHDHIDRAYSTQNNLKG